METDMNVTKNEQLPDMSSLSSLLGGLQDNKKQEEPANNKPKTYEEYKKEKEEKKKQEKDENEYQEFKQLMQKADEYLKQFDKAKLSKEQKDEIKKLKQQAEGGKDIKEKIQNLLFRVDRLVDIIFSVLFLGFLGAAAESQVQNEKKHVAIALKGKMGLPLEGKEKTMFARYQKEKQQEIQKTQQQKKDKTINNEQQSNKNNSNIHDDIKMTDIPEVQNNSVQDLQNINNNPDDNATKSQNDKKNTFLDHLSALETKKQQEEQQKTKAEILQNEPNDTLNQEDNNAKKDDVNNEPTNVLKQTDISNEQTIDVNKLLNKKQEQSKNISNDTKNYLEQSHQESKKDDISKETLNSPMPNEIETKNIQEQPSSKPEKDANDNKMKFDMQQKNVNNNAIPDNKQKIASQMISA